jgi:hypothetical protein
MTRLSRATALKIAAVLSFLSSAYLFVDWLPYLARGAADLSQGTDAPPYVVIVLEMVLAIVNIVAAYGVWQNQRWGVVVTLLATALATLLAVPGIFFPSSRYLWFTAITSTILGIVIIVLCLWRDWKVA